MFDAPVKYQLSFQDAATPIMEQIISLHDYIHFYLVLTIIFIFWILSVTIYQFINRRSLVSLRSFTHGATLEVIWTLIPIGVLLTICFPSLKLLYLTDEVIEPAVTIKTTGRQWYWSYEYGDYWSESKESISFDSYMVPEEDLELGQFRLLEVDNEIVVPTLTNVRIIVTGGDVIHAWAVPSLGVKMDAIPGRLNQTSFTIKRDGVYYGQCSELCGVSHGFMPIVVEGYCNGKFKQYLDHANEVYPSLEEIARNLFIYEFPRLADDWNDEESWIIAKTKYSAFFEVTHAQVMKDGTIFIPKPSCSVGKCSIEPEPISQCSTGKCPI